MNSLCYFYVAMGAFTRQFLCGNLILLLHVNKLMSMDVFNYIALHEQLYCVVIEQAQSHAAG